MAFVHRPKHFTAKKGSALKFGDRITHDPTHNCLTCVRWSACMDPNKGYNYRCSRHGEASLDGSSADEPRKFFAPETPELIVPGVGEMSFEEEMRIDEMIAAAIEENSPLPPDIKINDRDIPLAPNFMTWLLSDKFTGGDVKPFARQIYVGSLAFGEVCTRCTDMDWFERMRVDCSLSRMQERVEFLVHGKCKRCGTNRGELVEEGEMLDFNELVLICGQRSTKTSTVNQMDCYNTHRWLKLPSPAKVYRQLPQQVFTSTYTAKTFGQVRANVWEPFLNIVNNSPWFKNYNKFLAKRGQELGEELAVISEIFVRYRHRNLHISPASPSGPTMRGRTRFTAFIDEISYMPLKTAGGKESAAANAKDVHTVLKNSLKTLRIAHKVRFREGYYDIPKAMMYDVSSPLTINDYGMVLLRMSKVSQEMLGLKYKTWEFNPTLPESEFADDFRTKPVEAARDYACEPPLGQSTWLSDIETVSKAFHGKPNMYTVEHQVKRTRTRKRVTTAVLHKKMEPEVNWGCVLSLDIGSTNNCFAAETRVITRQGTKPIAKLVGKPVELLTSDSKWVQADVKSFGQGKLYEVHLSLHGATKTIRATSNHRWFAYNKSGGLVEITTNELKKGYKLQSNLPPAVHSGLKIDPVGVEHGAVFGDGTKAYTKNTAYSRAYLVGKKAEFLMPYFEHYKSRGKYWGHREGTTDYNAVTYVANLPLHYKDIPGLHNTDEYLLGFLSGYISTDGHVDKRGCVMLNSSDKKGLQRVRSIATRLGIPTSAIHRRWIEDPAWGGKPHFVYKLSFLKGYFPSRLLLNPEHKERLDKYTRDHVDLDCFAHTKWKVEAVVKTNQVEEVYCAVVPGTHSFTLEDYILTGNSFAFAVSTIDNDFDLQAYLDQDSDAEETTVGLIPIKVLFVGEVIPRQGAPISQSLMYRDILSTLCEDLPIRLVISDRWQNKKMVQDLEEEFGCEYVEFTLRWDDFENFKQALYDNEVELPRLKANMNDIVATTLDEYPHMFEGKPLEHLAYQFITVQEARGNTVIKGDATDDMFRCIALAHAACQDKEMLDALLEGDDEMAAQQPALGVVVSNSTRNTSVINAALTPRGQEAPVAMFYKKAGR